MSYFKKFADFCSGFAAFTALIYLFRQYMTFTPHEETEGSLEKLKQFFSKTDEYDNLLLLILALFFVASVLSSRLFAKRLSFIPVVTALPPLLLAVDMIKAEYIKEYPMLYVLFGALGVMAAIYECVRMDRADSKRRSAIAVKVVSLFTAAFCYYVYKKTEELSLISYDGPEFNPFERELRLYGGDMDIKLLSTAALIYLVLTVISILLTDIYFIDAILSVGPAVWLIYLWNAEKLTVHPELIVTLALCTLAVRTVPAFSGKAVKLRPN
ncbi:MAG: hypothetical protein J6B72_02720 [Clostridia bacterium]|nr:hypothetical protein [Clostridia bacterium]